MRRVLILVAAVAAGLIVAAGPGAALAGEREQGPAPGKDAKDSKRGNGWSFEPAVFVQTGGGEPGLAIGPDGALYVNSLMLTHDQIFKSTDGGASWSRLPPPNLPVAGNDTHVVVAPDNTVYAAAQWFPLSNCISVSEGPNGGAFWIPNPISCDSPTSDNFDRLWLAVSALGAANPEAGHRLYLYVASPCCQRHIVRASDDRGASWRDVGVVTEQGGFPGYLIADDDAGFLHAAFSCNAPQHDCTQEEPGKRVAVASSSDQGRTWTESLVAPLNTGDHGLEHVFLAKDAAGVLYTAWADDADGTGLHIWFARSRDHGATWSRPRKVSRGAGTHLFPTIAAGSRGAVVIAWYETDQEGDPNEMPAEAEWHVRSARSLNATAGRPRWARAEVTPKVIHRGSLCTAGARCASTGANRRLFEFFTVQMDDRDRALVTWADDTAYPAVPSVPAPTDIYFARSGR